MNLSRETIRCCRTIQPCWAIALASVNVGVMASIDLDDLAEELSGALGRVDCWAYAKVAGADELRDKHLRTLQEDGGAGLRAA